MVITKSKNQIFGVVKDRVNKKVKGWKNKFLSLVGVLLKSIAMAMPIYVMSCFRLPKKLCKDINSTMANFLWVGGEEKKRLHWVRWEKLSTSKTKGGIWALGYSVFE
ncbi:hypothetical protein ACH5RR_037633 [Cinchona calisaya]|uniref:Uncharacterized protein n=1 Tax=Cinchona calisaya TaxID=153742 RepID=A0ABD2YAG3_9GENT